MMAMIVKSRLLRLFTILTPLDFLCGNPIPFFPFPLSRGRGAYIREASPLFDSPLVFTP